MRYVLLCFVVTFKVVASFIVIKKINFRFNPNFGQATAVIETLSSGLTTMNVDANLTKPLNGKALV
jgi:multidrug efflux pump subunit AcrB